MVSDKFILAVLVSGRGSNLQAIIDSIEIRSLPVKIGLVISDVKNSFALERARKHNIDELFLDPKTFPDRKNYEQALVEQIQAKSVNLVCLAGFMRILGKHFINTFSDRIINIHPSLLPAFPGLNVQKRALEHGARFSGCTVHYVNEEVDGGPIILQSVVPIYDNDSEALLSERILEQEHIIYPEAIRLIAENRLTLSGRRVLHNK
ncbi:MAG: phosphoribosylglycinamide formyltransferase [Nitrospinaceae bacterium]|jgi:phosphoribosylglycinamide formyltransferase-1|nr:phosphoribosylglycinamide formyltransferase [Nitrospinaceae bacterium]HIK57705.1 phosphoribosylglycinamide formyltransferase [Nitrospinaceae bacterium]